MWNQNDGYFLNGEQFNLLNFFQKVNYKMRLFVIECVGKVLVCFLNEVFLFFLIVILSLGILGMGIV